MKKLLLTLCILVVLILTLTACSGDSNSLEGSWIFNYHRTVEFELQFLSDGTFTETLWLDGDIDEQATGTWNIINDNHLLMVNSMFFGTDVIEFFILNDMLVFPARDETFIFTRG